MIHILAPVLVTLSALAATPPGPVQENDFELARLLAKRGWFDLAEDACKRLLDNPRAKSDDRAAVPMVRAEIRIARAEAETDVEKAQDFMKEADALLASFAKDQPNHPMAMEARMMTGWLRARKGRMLADSVEGQSSPDKHTQLMQQAAAAYADAVNFYKGLLQELQKAGNSESVQNSIMDLRLELPRTMLEAAKMSSADAAGRTKMLEDAVKLLEDYEFDYGDRAPGFEAMLIGGQCLMELGLWPRAEVKLRGTVALKQRLAEAKVPLNDYFTKIIYGGYLSLSQCLRRAGKPAEAKKAIDLVLKDSMKESPRTWWLLSLKLEKGEALAALKDTTGAVAIANEVIKADGESGRYTAIARDKVTKWTSGGGADVSVTPDQMMTSADGYIDKGADREACIALRRCIEACTTPEEKTKYWAPAYFKMGQCLQGMRRNYEAAWAFEQVFLLYPKHEFASKAVFEAGRCYNNEFASTGDKRDEDAKEKYLARLAADYPKDPAARNIPYLQAEKLENAEDLKGAAEKYLTVTEDAEAYETALVRAGVCLFRGGAKKWSANPKDETVKTEVKRDLGRAEEVLQKFMKRLADPSKTPASADLVRARANIAFVANQHLALIYMHESMGRAKECLGFLDKCVEGLAPDDDRLSRIWGLQIQANLALGQLESAQKILEAMFEKFPDGTAIAQACKSVAIRLDEKTEELLKAKGDPETIKKNMKLVSRYYDKWLWDPLESTCRHASLSIL